MEATADKLAEAYFEKARSNTTWSGLPLAECYSPADRAGVDYERAVGDPGQFPYTRGIHADMYRGRFWTRRELCGYGSGADTNKRLLFQLREGASGLNVTPDKPHFNGVDADHPLALHEAGITGVSLSSLKDMEELLAGIPLDKVSLSLTSTTTSAMVGLAMIIAAAEKQGLDPARLRGTIQNDPIHNRYCGYGPGSPLGLSQKTAVDIIEHCTRHMPGWYTTTLNLYDWRENGISAAQELAFGIGTALVYVRKTIARGLAVDEFCPRMAFYLSAHSDLFEEVAKMRAARRLWARIMREQFGAQDPRSLQMRFGVHTAGCALTAQQPLNNIVRIAYQALAAVLGGAQSLHCCSYDEPIALPTEMAQMLALRTQEILAYETGVATVADPLGGSYYVESLTDRVEAEAAALLQRIEGMGGMAEAIRCGWVDQQVEEANLREQRKVESGQRLIVGLNVFAAEDEQQVPGGVHRLPEGLGERLAGAVRELRRTRDNGQVTAALARLRAEAERGEQHNLMPAVVAAARAYATVGEIMGTIREAFGYPYDPFEVIETPA